MSKLLDFLALSAADKKSEQFERYLRRIAWEKGIPLKGIFELTPRCNLNCSMCYVHLQDYQIQRCELDTDQWISLIDQACDAGMMYATLTGGECLLYPGFKEIYEHLGSRGVLISVLTNGTMLDEKVVSWLSERTPQRVQISVYGSSPEGYKKVTGSSIAFYKVDHAIDLLKEAGIPFNFGITESKDMVDDFEAILSYCESKEPGRFRVNSYLYKPRQGTKRNYEDYSLTLDQRIEAIKIQKKIKNVTIKEESCDDEPVQSENDVNQQWFPPKKGIQCAAGRNSFSINWEGNMQPCNLLDFTIKYPLTEGFLHSWKYINHRCLEYLNPVECIGCKYYSVCLTCPASHYMVVGQGHANPDICAEGNRAVAEKLRFLR